LLKAPNIAEYARIAKQLLASTFDIRHSTF